MAKILSARDALGIGMLVQYWAPELGVRPAVLRDLLIEDIANRQFDDGSLIVIAPGGTPHETNSAKLLTMLKKQLSGDSPLQLLQKMAEEDSVAIKRGAVLEAFCKRKTLPPPSFWPVVPHANKIGRKAKRLLPEKMAAFRARAKELHGKFNIDVVAQTLSDEFQVTRPTVREFIQSPRRRGEKIKSAN